MFKSKLNLTVIHRRCSFLLPVKNNKVYNIRICIAMMKILKIKFLLQSHKSVWLIFALLIEVLLI